MNIIPSFMILQIRFKTVPFMFENWINNTLPADLSSNWNSKKNLLWNKCSWRQYSEFAEKQTNNHFTLKVHWCRFENLPIHPSSSEKNMLKISHLNIFYILRYAHVRYVKSWFTHIWKQYNMLKISLLFKKFTNFTGK